MKVRFVVVAMKHLGRQSDLYRQALSVLVVAGILVCEGDESDILVAEVVTAVLFCVSRHEEGFLEVFLEDLMGGIEVWDLGSMDEGLDKNLALNAAFSLFFRIRYCVNDKLSLKLDIAFWS